MAVNVGMGMRVCACLLLSVGGVRLRNASLARPANSSDLELELYKVEGLESMEGFSTLSKGSCFKQGFKASKPFSPLEFVHIPRNAGTSVEMCSIADPSRAKDQKWGVANPNIQGLYAMPKPDNWGPAWPPKCYKQHVPPQYIPDVFNGDKETFCVVRDPYARMISQFKFIKIHSRKLDKDTCTADQMNSVLLDHLTKAKTTDPYFGDCHYLPQSVFVYGINPANAKVWYRTRGCKHILRLENLANDFGSLMEKHGYPYELLPNNKAGGTVGPGACSGLSITQLSPAVLKLIEEVYAEDFKHFEYTSGFSR